MPGVLEWQIVQAPFRFGVDEGTDPKQVPFGTLVTAKDVVWVKSGRLRKRPGITALTTGTVEGATITSAARLVVRGDELCLVTGSRFYSYTNSGWKLAANQGQISDVGLYWETIQSGYSGVQASDVALTSDHRLIHAWVTGNVNDGTLPAGALYYQIFDRDSSVRVTSPVAFDPAHTPRMVRTLAHGTDTVLVYDHGGSLVVSVNEAPPVVIKNDGKLSGMAFDACIIGSSFVVAYNLQAGGIQLAMYSIASTPILQQNVMLAGEAGSLITAISVDGSASDLLWIGYFVAGGSTVFKIATANATTLAQVLSPTVVDSSVSNMSQARLGVKRVSPSLCHYAYSATSAGNAYDCGVTISRSIANTGTMGAARTTAAVQLLTRPFRANGKMYAYVSRFMSATGMGAGGVDEFNPGDSYLIEMDAYDRALPHRLVGKVDVLTAGQWRNGHVSNPVAVSATETLAVLPTFAAVPTGVGSWWQNCLLASALTGASLPPDMWRSVQIGPEVYMAAGVLSAYDGRMVFDYGWASDAPFGKSFTFASVGGSVADGDYTYCVCPEYRSAAGILHRGPPNIPRRVTLTAATDSWIVTSYVIPVHLSQKYDDTGAAFVADPVPPELVVFRTVKDGTVLQRLTVEPKYNVLLQTLYAAPLPFNDNKSDFNIGNANLTLAARPALYTESGQVPDRQPPCLINIKLYRGRIMGISGDRQTVWFSKALTQTFGIAPGFNESFRVVFNDRLTGIEVLDERAIFFSDTGVYTLAGDGPNLAGQASDFVAVNKLQIDVGCTNPRGLCSGHTGVYFVSHNEIHLLQRDLTVEWVGKRVQGLLDIYPNVTSAVLVSSQNHVRFTCNKADGSAGVVLVYDYQEDQWSHFEYAGGVPIADAILHQNVYTFVTTSGQVYRENLATCLDNGVFVKARVVTAWCHAAGPLAYQCVRNFFIDGVSSSAHSLNVSVGFNGDDTVYAQGPKNWAEGVTGVTAPGPIQLAKVSISARRKCRSIRFMVEDSAPAALGTGAGPEWSTFGIEVGVFPNAARVNAAQQR